METPNGAPLIWNAAVQHRAALIMPAESPRDVQEAIRVARNREMRLSVLGGGHDWTGRARSESTPLHESRRWAGVLPRLT